MNVDAIPAELRDRPQWVLWRREDRDGKTTKVPYRAADPTRKASTTDPKTWAPFDAALAALGKANADGIGYVFSPDDPYAGVDLDACMNGNGELHDGATAILRALDTYSERSPSGTGVHTIMRADLGKSSRNRTGKTPWGGEFEAYSSGRYFAMTGAHLAGFPKTIEPRQQQLDDVLAGLFPRPVRDPATPVAVASLDLDDEELLERARLARNGADFDRLYRGDWQTDYSSNSEADMALASKLVFWCGPDPDRIDRLFRRSGLMRDKWESPRSDTTYGARTIAEALAGKTDFYRPGAASQSKAKTSPIPSTPQSSEPEAVAVVEERAPATLMVALLEDFANKEEAAATPLLGTRDSAALTENGTLLLYGDGGVGKTTKEHDLIVHLAAGVAWLGIDVPEPRRVLKIEAEGPRAPYRRKLKRKIDSWAGPEFAHNIFVLEEPWAAFTFGNETHRGALAAAILEYEIDVVSVGPLATIGAIGGGTPDEINAFAFLLADVRSRVGRPIAFILIHHENKAGDVSGAWERLPDTLVHAKLEGRDRSIIHWRKVHWSSELHNTKMTVRWLTDTEGFELEDAGEAGAAKRAAELQDATAWILSYVTVNPGLARSKVEDAFFKHRGKGGRTLARKAIDEQLLKLKELEIDGEQNGEEPVLAITIGERANGTYLIPFTDATSPLAAPLFCEDGEKDQTP